MFERLSNSGSKLVKSLKQKKYRDLNKLFVVEGTKCVAEAVHAADVHVVMVVYTGLAADFDFPLPENSFGVSPKELEIISGLHTPNRILAVCKMPQKSWEIDFSKPVLALDGISDPGNMGTIIRICDWFGVRQVVCSADCVDVYNPKVVQASMGSIFRVHVTYVDLGSELSNVPVDVPVFFTDMEGEAVSGLGQPLHPFVLVMGSESHGIRVDESIYVQGRKVTIPGSGNAESLNVAVSTGIILSHLLK